MLTLLPKIFANIGCRMVVHKKCHDSVQAVCPNSKEMDEHHHQENVEGVVAHQLSKKTFLRPTFCEHCGSLIYGLMKQGLKCGGDYFVGFF